MGATKKDDVKAYKERLLAMRARLRGDVSQMAESTLKNNRGEGNGELSSMPIHMADIGSENYEQEFNLGLLESGEEILTLIEAALERIEDGTFGTCEECGVKIPKMRLDAIPYATMCVKCASKYERG